MTLFSDVFKMQELKRPFFNFLVALIVLILISITIVGLIDQPNFSFMKGFANSWALFLFLFAVAFLQGQVIKRNLNQLRGMNDTEGLFNEYKKFYKKRLLLNFIPVFFCAMLFVLTFRDIFFYLLLMQLVFSFVFYPRKGQIERDLPGREIVYE